MSLTPGQKEAYARANNSTISLWVLEFRHSVFPAPIRLAQHTEDIDVLLEPTAPVDANTTQTFIAMAFRFSEPPIEPEPDSTVSIEIDGVSGALQPFLDAASTTGEAIEGTLRPILYDVFAQTVLDVFKPLHLQTRVDESTMTSVSVTLGYTNSANQSFPDAKYTPTSHPGLL